METQKENKMGTMPENKLLISMSLPIMISMLVQALYNIVDSIFVAQYSADAFTAVSLAFPIQSLMIAVSVGTGVGINSLLSRRLGAKRFNEASQAATNGLLMCAISSIVFAILGIAFSRTFFAMFTDNQTVIEMGTQYLMICTIFSFGIFLQVAAERILQATGKTIFNMITQGTGAIINIILDPILIFGLLGFPRMGIAGAAIATVVGQIVGMALALYFNHKKNHEISISFRGFKPNFKIIKEIYQVGFPSIVMQAIVSVMGIAMNKILATDVAVSVFGAYVKLQSFVFMPVFGLTSGMIPIVGYNYGAGNKHRIVKTIKLSFIYAVAIMFIGTVLFQLFPEQLFKIFNASDEIMVLGVPALKIISTCFVFAGMSIVISSVFQAVGTGILSLIISIARQLVVILPTALILNMVFGVGAVWYSFPLSEIVSGIIGLFMFKHVYHKYIMSLKN